MKLLFYIHGITGGGAERVMAVLMNSFVDRGHQVRVVYTSSTSGSVYPLDSRIEEVYMLEHCKRRTSSLIDKIYRRLWKYHAIRRQANQFCPDYVISFIRSQNNDVLLALLGTGFPVIVSDHTNINRKYPLQTMILSKLLYPFAGAVTMLTLCDYEKWKSKYRNVYYIPNPCDIKRSDNFIASRKVVLGVGRVNQWEIKGFDSLITAWSKICDKYPEWTCQIAGLYSEDALNSLRSKVGDKAFSSVEFLGFRTDIYNYMESCEVFCLSSRTEGMPMVLLEALNLGCACVAFDCITGPSEMIVDGSNGLLVRDQDVDDLAQKLSAVISDGELRDKFHQNAPQSVSQYSTDNVLKLWFEMFNDLKRNRS